MFEPEKPIAHLPLNDMTPAQLVDEIINLVDTRHKRAHFDYYNMQMGAIKILAELAAEKMQGFSVFGSVLIGLNRKASET